MLGIKRYQDTRLGGSYGVSLDNVPGEDSLDDGARAAEGNADRAIWHQLIQYYVEPSGYIKCWGLNSAICTFPTSNP